MNTALDVVVLAAGRGKRMHSEIAKVLHPIGGRPMLAHVLDSVSDLVSILPSPWKLQHLHLIYGYAGEQVQAAVDASALPQALARQGVGIHWHEQKQQRGTGHALMQARHALPADGHCLVLFGDVPLIQAQSLAGMIKALSEFGAPADLMDCTAILTAKLDQPAGYGRILRDPDTEALIGIVEERDANPQQQRICEVNSGIMLLPNRRLASWLDQLSDNNAQGEYYLTDVIGIAHGEHLPVLGYPVEDPLQIQGVNTLGQLIALERVYQLRLAERLLAQGVTIMDPARFDVRGSLHCEENVHIDIDVLFQGEVILRHGTRIGAHCVLIDTEVHEGAEILPFTHCESAVIGAKSRVGPFARLRPGTVLGDANHVGNFVEMKAATTGSQTKANHLAYVGDALIGSRVNIGAGTITCNYDGANKHQTVIEDDAFIGSDSQLVAPVRVGAGATLGAGTTLTRDAPAGELTVSRARQLSVSGWKRPQKAGEG